MAPPATDAAQPAEMTDMEMDAEMDATLDAREAEHAAAEDEEDARARDAEARGNTGARARPPRGPASARPPRPPTHRAGRGSLGALTHDAGPAERSRAATASARTATTTTRPRNHRPRTQSEAPETFRMRAHTDYLETVRFATVQKANQQHQQQGARPARERTSSITLGLLARSRTTSGRFYERRGSVSNGGADTQASAITRLRGRRNSSVHAVDLNVLESMRVPEERLISNEDPVAEENSKEPEAGPAAQQEEPVSDLEEETCLICLGRFSAKRPAVPIPCSKQCNLAPVHAKCIYEWKEQKKGAGSCPLCRSDLGTIDYQPRDVLRLNSLVLFGYRKQFAMSPVPQSSGTLRCYVKVRNGVFGSPVRYELWVQAPTTLAYPLGALPDEMSPRAGDKFLIAGSKRLTRWGSSVIDLSVDPNCKDFAPTSHNYLGSVNGNIPGTEFTVTAPMPRGAGAKRFMGGTPLRELAAVAYTQNRLGNGSGPRRLTLALASAKACDSAEAANLALGLPAQAASPENKDREASASPGAEGAGRRSVIPGGDGGAAAGGHVSIGSQDSEAEDSDDEEDSAETFVSEVLVPRKRGDYMVSHLRKGAEAVNSHGQMIFGQNKEPYWLESIQAYSLDFHGRVQLPSNKNFKLQLDGLSETDALQFGKVVAITEDVPFAIYTCDFRWPVSPMQAFGIVLTACDRKMFVA